MSRKKKKQKREDFGKDPRKKELKEDSPTLFGKVLAEALEEKSLKDTEAEVNRRVASLCQLTQEARWEEARAHFERLPPTEQLTQKEIGAELYWKMGKIELSKQNFNSAKQAFTKANELGSTDKRDLNERLQAIALSVKHPDSTYRHLVDSIEEKDLYTYMTRHGLHHPPKDIFVPGVSEVFVLGIYRWQGDVQAEDTYSQAIREMKKGEIVSSHFAQIFGLLLAEGLRYEGQQIIREVDCIVYVPPDPLRAQDRGFHPPQIIAQKVGHHFGIPIVEGTLSRKAGPRSRDCTQYQLAQQYTLNTEKTNRIAGKTVLLIDDVITKGRTAKICSELLRQGKSNLVFFAAVARALSTLKEAVIEETATSNLACWHCLGKTHRLGPLRLKNLVEHFGSVEALLNATREELQQVKGIGKKVSELITHQQPLIEDSLEFIKEQSQRAHVLQAKILSPDSPLYPEVLKQSGAAPPLLYFVGVESILEDWSPSVAIVGTRNPHPLAKDIATKLASGFARIGWCVISGLAKGIDAAAHYGALKAKGKTVAVLGSGVDIVYPKENQALYQDIRRYGAIASELPFGTRVSAINLQKRNKITVGCSKGVVVLQTAVDGGTMIAARAAREQGKKVFCLEPIKNDTTFDGNLQLIKTNGAIPFSSEEDLLKIVSQLGG